MRIRPLLLLFIVLLSGFGAFAQTQKITGVIKDAESGDPLPFIIVAVKGTTNGTSTDVNGNFSLEGLSASDTLVFSYVGYLTQSVRVGTQNILSVKLQPKLQELNEVVVTALGVIRQ